MSSKRPFPRIEFSAMLIALSFVGVIISIPCVAAFNRMETASDTQTHLLPLTTTVHTKLIVSDDNGSLSIHARKTGPFDVTERKSFSGIGFAQNIMNVSYIRTGATLEMNAHIQRSFLFVGKARIDLDISVPIDTDIIAYTQAGTINITGLQSVIVAETGTTGSITIHNTTGKITLKTFTGSITANNIAGQVVLTAQRGDVDVSRAIMKGSSQLEAASGSINFYGTLDRVGSYHFETVHGPINITLPASSLFRLFIRSGSGPLSNDFVQTSGSKGQQAMVTINAQNNSIKVHKAPEPCTPGCSFSTVALV